jgi:predicted transcriptional regulator
MPTPKIMPKTKPMPKSKTKVKPKPKAGDSVADLLRPSRSEWELLSMVVKLGSPSIPQILQEALERERVLDYYTSHKLLNRLVEKGYLKTEKERSRVQYVPQVDWEVVLQLEVERFLDEVVGDDRAGLEVVKKVLAQRLRNLADPLS